MLETLEESETTIVGKPHYESLTIHFYVTISSQAPKALAMGKVQRLGENRTTQVSWKWGTPYYYYWYKDEDIV